MIHRQTIDNNMAQEEFGTRCQRLLPIPGQGGLPEPAIGSMACFLSPNTESAPDRHNQDELIVVLAGAARVALGGEVVDVATGDVVLLPRNTEHVVRNVSDHDELSWLSVYWPLREPAVLGE